MKKEIVLKPVEPIDESIVRELMEKWQVAPKFDFVFSEGSQFALVVPRIDILKCPVCGDSPELEEKRYGGHGDGCIDYFVECACGLRGKNYCKFDFINMRTSTQTDINLSDGKAKYAAVDWWNNFVSRYNKE